MPLFCSDGVGFSVVFDDGDVWRGSGFSGTRRDMLSYQSVESGGLLVPLPLVVYFPFGILVVRRAGVID